MMVRQTDRQSSNIQH